MPKKKNKSYWFRIILQTLFLLLIVLISYNRYRLAQGLVPIPVGTSTLHSLCPFGGVVTLYQYFTQGTFIRQIHQSSFTLMWLVLLLSLFFGPVFCGWVCPIGTVQEFIGKIGKKIFPKKYNRFVPYKIDIWLRYLRYIVLILIVVLTAKELRLVFQNYCPYFSLFNIWSNEVALSALILLGFIFIGSLFIERPWCKYLCPLGALLGIFNLFRIVKLKRNNNTCIQCKKCDNICPMNIKVSNKEVIRDHQCISCLLCTDEITCPVNNTLHLTLLKKKDSKKNIWGG